MAHWTRMEGRSWRPTGIVDCAGLARAEFNPQLGVEYGRGMKSSDGTAPNGGKAMPPLTAVPGRCGE